MTSDLETFDLVTFDLVTLDLEIAIPNERIQSEWSSNYLAAVFLDFVISIMCVEHVLVVSANGWKQLFDVVL